MKIDTAFLHALRAADDLDRAAEAAGRHLDLTARARVRMDTALAAKYCREAVELLVAAHGTSSLGRLATGCSGCGATSTSPAITPSPSGR